MLIDEPLKHQNQFLRYLLPKFNFFKSLHMKHDNKYHM